MTQKPTNLPICRKRGDTYPFTFTIKDSAGVAVDITGFSYLFTVDPGIAPADSTANLFQVVGVITDAVGGKVEIQISAANADNVGSFFYDLEQTDAALKERTVAEGTYELTQDITK